MDEWNYSNDERRCRLDSAKCADPRDRPQLGGQQSPMLQIRKASRVARVFRAVYRVPTKIVPSATVGQKVVTCFTRHRSNWPTQPPTFSGMGNEYRLKSSSRAVRVGR